MICPEVWDFKPPQHNFAIERRDYKNKEIPNVITTHYFNHSVSVVLPDTVRIPNTLQENILEDSDYYRIGEVHAAELLNYEFIEAFVKKGELSLLTVGCKIDLDNSIAIIPTGVLIISLIAEDFRKLGLEGKSSFFDRKVHTRYVVEIDLKEKCFTPGKKNYERTKTSLEEHLNQTFNVIVAWHPPEDNVCPSSIAAWFYEHGHNVSLCHQKHLRRTEYSLMIPSTGDNYDLDKFFEWLGVFSISGDLKIDNTNDYVNTYKCPSPCSQVGQVQYLQWTGFFTQRQIKSFYLAVKEYLLSRDMFPWGSMHVQGFSDSPISWDLKEHTFFMDGDNSYTILFEYNGKLVIRRSLSSNNKLRISQ